MDTVDSARLTSDSDTSEVALESDSDWRLWTSVEGESTLSSICLPFGRATRVEVVEGTAERELCERDTRVDVVDGACLDNIQVSNDVQEGVGEEQR